MFKLCRNTLIVCDSVNLAGRDGVSSPSGTAAKKKMPLGQKRKTRSKGLLGGQSPGVGLERLVTRANVKGAHTQQPHTNIGLLGDLVKSKSLNQCREEMRLTNQPNNSASGQRERERNFLKNIFFKRHHLNFENLRFKVTINFDIFGIFRSIKYIFLNFMHFMSFLEFRLKSHINQLLLKKNVSKSYISKSHF